MTLATRTSFLAIVVLVAASIARAQYGSSPSDGFSLQRWEEDYSHLKDDPSHASSAYQVKYIRLHREGDVYMSLGGQARYRYDYFNNRSFGPGENDEDGFHLQRYLVHADTHFGENFRAFVQFDSSFNDDREGGSRYGDEQHFDIQQAFIDIKTSNDANPFAYLRLGRQELTYGAERFVSPDDWRNVRRSFDGAKIAISIPDNTTEAFITRPVFIEQHQWDNPEPESYFSGIYNVTALPDVINADANSKLDTYFFALNQGEESTAGVDVDTYTLGGRFHTTPAPFDFDVESNYQFGEVTDDSISAWSFATELGFTFDAAEYGPRASIGLDVASGSPEADGRFNQLFPPTYTYLGHLYLFGRVNIIDAHAGLDVHLTNDLTLYLDQHVFWRQNDDDALYNLTNNVVRADNGSDAMYVGTEFNIVLNWQVTKHWSTYVGYAHFFTGDFLNETGPSRDVDFFYAAVTWTF